MTKPNTQLIAATALQAFVKPGTEVLTRCEYVSRQGTTRKLAVFVDGPGGLRNISADVAAALEMQATADGQTVVVNGCGMDMGWHLINELSHEIWPGARPLRHCWL